MHEMLYFFSLYTLVNRIQSLRAFEGRAFLNEVVASAQREEVMSASVDM